VSELTPKMRGFASVAVASSLCGWVVNVALGLTLACNSTPEPNNPAGTTTAPLVTEPAPSAAPSSDPPPATAASAMADPGCEIGGCSGELCQKSGTPKVFTTCDVKREWQCYHTAHCMAGADGTCAWQNTPELEKCLKVH
jgi:hypothetical protein